MPNISLFRYGNSYGRKKFDSTGPWNDVNKEKKFCNVDTRLSGVAVSVIGIFGLLGNVISLVDI